MYVGCLDGCVLASSNETKLLIKKARRTGKAGLTRRSKSHRVLNVLNQTPIALNVMSFLNPYGSYKDPLDVNIHTTNFKSLAKQKWPGTKNGLWSGNTLVWKAAYRFDVDLFEVQHELTK